MAWLTGWNRRKFKNINGSTSLQTNYQLKLTVHKGTGTDSSTDVYLGTNVRDDFGDVRFTSSDGSTLLNYWIESITGTTPNFVATIWIQISSIPTGTNSSTIYIYYDNPTQTTTSSGIGTFLFFDDFNRATIGTDWTTGGGSWSIISNQLVNTQPGSSPNGRILYNVQNFGDVAVDVNAKYTDTAGIIARTDNLSTDPIYNGYFISGYFNGAKGLIKSVNGTNTTLGSATTSFDNTLWHTVSFRLYSSNLSYYIDDTLQTSATDATFSTNKVGLYCHSPPGATTYYFDDFRVRKYISPEPSWSTTFGTEELPNGNLDISSTPSGAEIFIGGVDQFATTPSIITGITPGNIRVTLTKAGYLDRIISTTIIAGETTVVSTILTSSSSIPSLANTPWPKYHRDLKNTGQSPYTSYADGTIKWVYNPGTGTYPGINFRGTPTIDSDGTIYISGDGYLYALYSDGTLKWSSLNGGGYSSPIISSNVIYNVGDTNLYAIDPIDGSVRWSYPLDAAYETSPAIGLDGTIYVSGGKWDSTYSTNISTLYAINPDGTLKWKYISNTTGLYGDGKSRPAIGTDGTVYTKMNEYNSSTGVDTIYLYAINPDTGEQIWRTYIGNAANRAQAPAIGSDGTIYIAATEQISFVYTTYLYAINPTDGSIIWSYPMPGSTECCPAIATDGTIYIGIADYDNLLYYMYAVDANGNLKANWPYTVIYEPRSPPLIGQDGVIYFGTDGIYNDILGYSFARFYALNPNGTLKWYVDIPTGNSIVSPPSMAPDGTIYVAVDSYNDPAIDKRVVAFQSTAPCPSSLKYSGDTITMKATPKDGIGPYYVEFQKAGIMINQLLLGDEFGGMGTNPIIGATENVEITRVYTLTDADIAGATLGTIDFSVYMTDSCPTGPMTCTDTCTINIGCVAPVCNFVVT